MLAFFEFIISSRRKKIYPFRCVKNLLHQSASVDVPAGSHVSISTLLRYWIVFNIRNGFASQLPGEPAGFEVINQADITWQALLPGVDHWDTVNCF